MSDMNIHAPSGFSLCLLMTVSFVVLKLCSVIEWSWWWVLSPLWIPWAVVFGIVFAVLFLAVVLGKVNLRITTNKEGEK